MGQRSRGHSLLELCCVLGVSALMLAVSLPSIGPVGPGGGTRGAQLLLSDLRPLPALARAVESEIDLYLAPSEYRFELAGREPRLLRRVTLAPGHTLHTGRNAAPITFRPAGSATPRSFQLHNAHTVCTFTVSLRSRIRYWCGETE